MQRSAPARIPHVPVLSLSSFRSGGARPPSILDAGPAIHLTSGRVALAMALKASGVGPGDQVLVPAWHSQSMIPPVEWCGAEPVFYRLLPDTSPDLDDIAIKAGPGCRAIMATHFFGFVRDLGDLRHFCDSRCLRLVEDCAHAFFGPVGRWGDYAAASTMKFFPTYEGGCLVSARHALPAAGSGGIGFEAKAALAALERSFDHGRLGGLRALLWAPMQVKQFAWNRMKARKGSGPAAALAPSSSDSSCLLDTQWIGKRSSGFSRSILALAGHGRIAAARRANYRRLDQALAGLPGCRPLFPALADGVVPWMYPLLVEDAEHFAAQVTAAGLPLTRFGFPPWPGMDPSTCSVSARLSRQVLAFPCHQELSEGELARLINGLRALFLDHGRRAA